MKWNSPDESGNVNGDVGMEPFIVRVYLVNEKEVNYGKTWH
jgi:hypothetical protein